MGSAQHCYSGTLRTVRPECDHGNDRIQGRRSDSRTAMDCENSNGGDGPDPREMLRAAVGLLDDPRPGRPAGQKGGPRRQDLDLVMVARTSAACGD